MCVYACFVSESSTYIYTHVDIQASILYIIGTEVQTYILVSIHVDTHTEWLVVMCMSETVI